MLEKRLQAYFSNPKNKQGVRKQGISFPALLYEVHMRAVFIPALLAAALCFSTVSVAAVHNTHISGQTVAHAPALQDMAGQEVDTKYFKVVLPKEWSMPVPVQEVDGGYTVVFANMAQSPAVSISIMQAPMDAKQIGEMTLANMKKGGMKATPLEEKDGLWQANISSGKGKGKVWFGDNQKEGLASVTIIVGDGIDRAEELLSAFESKVEGLLPKSIK